MSTWAGTTQNAGGHRPVGLGGEDFSSTTTVSASPTGALDGDWSWVGDVAIALVKGLLAAREGAASHTMSETFPRPVTGAESDCCRGGFPGFGTAPLLPDARPGIPLDGTGPAATGAGRTEAGGMESIQLLPKGPTLATDTPTTFESEVRGQAAREIDLDLAAMAEDVYDLDSRGIDGWNRLDEAELEAAGIAPEMLEDPRTGFRAAIYTDGDGRHVLAFAGTDATEIPDWLANFGQGLGFDADQYAQAERLAARAVQAFGDDLVMTGHSLGGGLAATAALATDSAAVTFNAAGLHSNTIRDLDLDPDAARTTAEEGLIRNYRVDGEALTHVQEESTWLAPLAPDAVGHPIELADPHSFWEHLNPLNLWEPSHRVRLHLMDAVLDALRQDRPWERTADAD